MSQEQIPEEDGRILTMLPLVVEWIKRGKDLTDVDIKTFGKLHPDHYKYAKNTPLSEILEMSKKYQDHRLYKDHIRLILSEKGTEWLRRNLERVREFAVKNDTFI